MTETASATASERSSVSRRLIPADTVRPVNSHCRLATGRRLTEASSTEASPFKRSTAPFVLAKDDAAGDRTASTLP